MAWNSRVDHVAPFRVMHLLEMAQAREAAGHDVIHLEVGEPDFATPAPIVAAGQQALAEGKTRYTPAAGLASLREAIAGHYAEHFNATVDPARILVTPGASGALLLASQLLVESGDRVLMADPNYPCNRHFMALAGAEIDTVPVGRDSSWQLTAPLIEQHWQAKTRLAMLASPSNPTGHTLDAEALTKVIDTEAAKGGDVIVDEIYQGLNYDDAPLSATSLSDDAFVVNSFSKYFGMTGWRLGWLVAPKEAIGGLEKLAQNLYICAPHMAQQAALAAFSEQSREICELRRRAFQVRRDFLLPAVRELGFAVPVTPEGAFYLYADMQALGGDSAAFCQHVIEREFVALTPGLDFGQHRADQHLRLAYTTSLERLEQAVERLQRALGSWSPAC